MRQAQGSDHHSGAGLLAARPEPATDASIRERWFPAELTSTPSEPNLLGGISALCRRLLEADKVVRQAAIKADRAGEAAHVDLARMATDCALQIQNPADLLPARHAAATSAELRVVLMGRTQAGKSTLLEALSHGTGDRRGDGRQRYSDDVCTRALPEVPGVVLVDTPGVGALDGSADYEKAFAEVPDADVIVWVASNNAAQEETARALRTLGVLGKPVIVALNCRFDLGEPMKRQDFLDDPAIAFRDTQGNINAIERQLARAGSQSMRVVTLHADAAFLATQEGPDAQIFRSSSNVEALYSVLRQERSQRADQRRALSQVDRARTPANQYLASLSDATNELAASVHTSRAVTRDLAQRMTREIDRHEDLLAADLRRVIEERRTWHLTVSLDEDIEKKWRAETATMESEIEATVERSQTDLAAALKDTAHRVLTDWESLPLDSFGLGAFTGFGSVWKNRASRAALGIGGSGLGLWGGFILGAKIGAAVGIEGGPLAIVTSGVGAVIGAGIGVLVRPLKDYLNTVFHGKAAVLLKRQHELRLKIHPVLDEIETSLAAWSKEATQRHRQSLDAVFDGMHAVIASQEKAYLTWASTGTRVQAAIDEVDTVTGVAMLSMIGRERLSSRVTRAVRSPGAAVAVEFTAEGFAEAALFPPLGTAEKMLTVGPMYHCLPAGQALPLALALSLGRIRVDHLAATEARLSLLDETVPSGITRTWSDLLAAFTNSTIELCADPATEPVQQSWEETR